MAKSPDRTSKGDRRQTSVRLKIPDGGGRAGRVPLPRGDFREWRSQVGHEGGSEGGREEDEQATTFCFCGFWFSFASGAEPGGAGGDEGGSSALSTGSSDGRDRSEAVIGTRSVSLV